jgi:hypothetical protein
MALNLWLRYRAEKSSDGFCGWRIDRDRDFAGQQVL